MTTKLSTWGTGVGVRIPKDLMVTKGLSVGQEVELIALPEGVLIRPSLPRFNLSDLVAQMKPENQPELTDLGTVGEEKHGWA